MSEKGSYITQPIYCRKCYDSICKSINFDFRKQSHSFDNQILCGSLKCLDVSEILVGFENCNPCICEGHEVKICLQEIGKKAS